MTDHTIIEISRHSTKPVWADRLDELKGYLSDRMSYGVIAEKFGVTRGAVSGAVDRYNLRLECPTRRLPLVSRRPRTSAGKPRKSRTTEARKELEWRFPEKTEPTEATEISIEFIPPSPVSFVELEEHHCRFPIGDYPVMFCGEMPKEDRPYCTAHCRIAYRPMSPHKPWVEGRGEG